MHVASSLVVLPNLIVCGAGQRQARRQQETPEARRNQRTKAMQQRGPARASPWRHPGQLRPAYEKATLEVPSNNSLPSCRAFTAKDPAGLLGGQAGLSKHSCRHLPASMSCVSQPGSCQGLSCISQFCRPWCSRAVLPAREHHRCRSSALGSRHVAMQGPETAAGRIYRFESATEHHRYRSSALGSRHIAMQGPETAAGRTYRCEFATEHHRCRSSALGSRHIAMQGPETAAGELTNLSLQPRMSAAVPSSTSSARNASASAGLPPTRSQPMGPAAGTTAGENVKSAQAEAAPSAQLPAATSAWSAEKAVLDEDPTHAEPAAGPGSASCCTSHQRSVRWTDRT